MFAPLICRTLIRGFRGFRTFRRFDAATKNAVDPIRGAAGGEQDESNGGRSCPPIPDRDDHERQQCETRRNREYRRPGTPRQVGAEAQESTGVFAVAACLVTGSHPIVTRAAATKDSRRRMYRMRRILPDIPTFEKSKRAIYGLGEPFAAISRRMNWLTPDRPIGVDRYRSLFTPWAIDAFNGEPNPGRRSRKGSRPSARTSRPGTKPASP